MEWEGQSSKKTDKKINPLTLKIWFLILPSSHYKCIYKSVMRIWC